MHIIPIYNKIREYLLESGHYAAYRDKFISQKLNTWHNHYRNVPESMKPRFAAIIREALSEDDWEFCRTSPKKLMPKNDKLFYVMIDGGLKEAINYRVSQVVRPIVSMPERFLRHWVIKPIKKRLKAA